MAVDMQEEIQGIKLQVSLLEKDIQLTSKFCEQVSESMQRIQEVNMNFIKMISLCEQKHIQHEKAESCFEVDIKELHSRITTVNREMHDRMMQVEHHISEKIDCLRGDLMPEEPKEERGFNSKYDKFFWMVVGAALTIGWVIGNVNLQNFSNLFK